MDQVNGFRIVFSRRSELQALFHCNYGWAGICNGYYNPDLFFDTSAGPEYTESTDGDQNENDNKNKTSYYSHISRIITYTGFM